MSREHFYYCTWIYILLGFILGVSYTESSYKENKEIIYFFILNMYMYFKLKGMLKLKLLSLTRINCPVRVFPSLYLYQIPFDQFVQYWLVMVLFTFWCHYLHTQKKQESRTCQFNNSCIYVCSIYNHEFSTKTNLLHRIIQLKKLKVLRYLGY